MNKINIVNFNKIKFNGYLMGSKQIIPKPTVISDSEFGTLQTILVMYYYNGNINGEYLRYEKN